MLTWPASAKNCRPSCLSPVPCECNAARGRRAELPSGIVSLQNAYSLLCRTFDAGLAECCQAEKVSLLAYSPLAMGLLTGKYQTEGGGPPEAR